MLRRTHRNELKVKLQLKDEYEKMPGEIHWTHGRDAKVFNPRQVMDAADAWCKNKRG